MTLNLVAGRSSLEEIELRMLLESIFQYYGYDFRNYALTTIVRRLRWRLKQEGLDSFSMLQDRLLRDADCMQRIFQDLSVTSTQMFRDPQFFELFRKVVIPYLRTVPFIRIWAAGCAGGEEVYSMAILLHQEGLLHKSRIYGTDLNANSIDRARAGVYKMQGAQEAQKSCENAGMEINLSQYFETKENTVQFYPWLRERTCFAVHNLISDSSFQEFQAILCRNVVIYFNKELQNKSHALLHESLCRLGYLALGRDESLSMTAHESRYKAVGPGLSLYRKIA